MAIGDAIRAGLAVREYVDNNAKRQEEAKLKAQLYGAQAKHYDAQNQLINIEVQKHQQYLDGLQGALMGSQAPAPSQGGRGGIATEEQTPSFVAPPSALSEAPPQTSGLSAQPGSAGPQAPGNLSVAQLHDTTTFLDPQEQLMDRLSMLALRTGNTKDYAAMQQGMIERQKIRTAARLQQLQDKLGLLQQLEAGPLSDADRAAVRNGKAAMLFQIGKSNDALQSLEGKVLAIQPGGSAVQVLPGDTQAKVLYQSPVTPFELARQRGAGTQTGSNEANLAPPVGVPARQAPLPPATPAQEAAPGPGLQRFTTMIDGKPATVDAKDAAAAQALLQQEFPGRTFQLTPVTPAAPTTVQPLATAPSPTPSASPGLGAGATLAAQKKQADMNTELYGSATPPAGKPNATAALLEAAKEAKRLETQGLEASNPQNPVARQTVQAGQDAKTGTRGATQADVTAADAQAHLNTEYYGRSTPPAGEPPATAAMVERSKTSEGLRTQGLEPNNPARPIVGQQEQARQDAQAGKPGATKADVDAQGEQAKLNVQVYGSAIPPAGKPPATVEDVTRAHTMGQPVPDIIQEKINTFTDAQRLVHTLQAVPEAKQQEYVGLLRRPKAQLQDFFADLNKAGSGDAQRYAFVAAAKDLFYAVNRIKVGANFTKVEQDLLDGVFPDTGVASYTQFKAALDRLPPLLTQRLQDVVALTGSTRGTIAKDVQQRGNGPPAPAPETPSKQDVERRLREKGLIQ